MHNILCNASAFPPSPIDANLHESTLRHAVQSTPGDSIGISIIVIRTARMRHPTQRSLEHVDSGDFDDPPRTIAPHTTLDLHFDDERQFAWSAVEVRKFC